MSSVNQDTNAAVNWPDIGRLPCRLSIQWTYDGAMSEGATHVVGRVAALLRSEAQQEPAGLTTTEAALAAVIPRASAHRLLSSLEHEDLVERASDGRWLLGAEAHLLGLASRSRHDVTDAARQAVEQLASATGESAFFSTRRGAHTVCLLEEEGSFPLRSHVLHEGARFPLGVASAGLVILSHLQDGEVEAHLRDADLSPWGRDHDAERVRERIAATRRTGYAENPGLVVAGSWGMAAAVFDHDGRPTSALSLTGVESRFGADRRPALGRALLDAAHALSRASRASGRRSSAHRQPGRATESR